MGNNHAENKWSENILEAFKFVCKQLWLQWWSKPIDSLRTNHHGKYVLIDEDFALIRQFMHDSGDELSAYLAVLVPIQIRCGTQTYYVVLLLVNWCSTWPFRVDY